MLQPLENSSDISYQVNQIPTYAPSWTGKDQKFLQENKRYQGNISCKDGHNKGQKLDLTEAEDIKKKWQGYIEELYKKDLNDPDNYNVCV